MKNVSFIGLGNMGSGMASNIVNSEHNLTVWNRTVSKAAPLAELGARVASTLQEAAKDADVVITSLMDDQSILDNLSGASGLLGVMKPGAVHL